MQVMSARSAELPTKLWFIFSSLQSINNVKMVIASKGTTSFVFIRLLDFHQRIVMFEILRQVSIIEEC